MHRQSGKVGTCGFSDIRADRQTDRQTNTLTTVLRIPTEAE